MLINLLLDIFCVDHDKRMKELDEEIKQIDREFFKKTVPKTWQPGMIDSSETKYLWGAYKKNRSPVEKAVARIYESMAPKKTGELRCTITSR